jgi:hypothetical protein
MTTLNDYGAFRLCVDFHYAWYRGHRPERLKTFLSLANRFLAISKNKHAISFIELNAIVSEVSGLRSEAVFWREKELQVTIELRRSINASRFSIREQRIVLFRREMSDVEFLRVLIARLSVGDLCKRKLPRIGRNRFRKIPRERLAPRFTSPW